MAREPKRQKEEGDLFGALLSRHAFGSKGIAGTMLAHRSGLQTSPVRNIVLAWVLTLPAAIVLSAALFWLFRAILPA
jgi:PiT family inorganic phosphate transporter